MTLSDVIATAGVTEADVRKITASEISDHFFVRTWNHRRIKVAAIDVVRRGVTLR